MKNFSLENLVLINPKCSITTETFGFAMHGKEIVENAKILTIEKENYGEMLRDFLKNFNLVIATSGRTVSYRNIARVPIYVDEFEFPSIDEGEKYKIAVMFGRESVGFMNEEIQLSDILLAIPANQEYPVMNISHAAAVVFFTLYKKMHSISRGKFIPATHEQRVMLMQKAESVVNSLTDEEAIREMYMTSLKNAVGRSFGTRNEINHLTRLFDKIFHRMRKLKEDNEKLSEKLRTTIKRIMFGYARVSVQRSSVVSFFSTLGKHFYP